MQAKSDADSIEIIEATYYIYDRFSQVEYDAEFNVF